MESTSPAVDWEPCSPGTLSEAAFVTAHRGVARRLPAPRFVAGAVAGCVLAAIVIVAVSFRTEPVAPGPIGGMTCAIVHDNLPAYVSGQLAPELARQIEDHLAACPPCRQAHERMLQAEQMAVWIRSSQALRNGLEISSQWPHASPGRGTGEGA